MELKEIIGQTVVKDGGKPVIVNSYDAKRQVFYDFTKGKAKKENVISLDDILNGKAVIQERLF